jgi:hypothetical protein
MATLALALVIVIGLLLVIEKEGKRVGPVPTLMRGEE